MDRPDHFESLLRELSPQALAVVVRRYGDFAACEDAVQEALIAASEQWVSEVPDNPLGWLVTVASRRWIEQHRRDSARVRREEANAANERAPDPAPGTDDSLTLLMLCCHPSLTPESQIALTLRAVGGLTTAEIARAFLVSESTMGQRISRAKQTIQKAGATFAMPPESERAARTSAVFHVLYLIFNEGYTATSGDELVRLELTTEAIRLTRQLYERLPEEGEVGGLLALMLLTEARRGARTSGDGSLIPLSDQDRTRWDARAIAEGSALISAALERYPIGPYQLQAAIAAVHDEAATADETDWRQILVLYDMLAERMPGPMVTLNRIVALARVEGVAAGLRALDDASATAAVGEHHRVESVRAHLLELAGERDAARAHYVEAAARTLSEPERRYLQRQADRLR